MLQDSIARQLNAQINNEFFSAYLYLDMSAKAEQAGFKGMSAWFMGKYFEENQHALKIYHYVLDHGSDIEMSAIDNPGQDYQGPLDMFEQTLAHEQSVTAMINDLVDAAMTARDHATYAFLQWFVTEQTEEEATVNDIIAQLKLVGERGEGLFMIDREIASMATAMPQSLAPSPAA